MSTTRLSHNILSLAACLALISCGLEAQKTDRQDLRAATTQGDGETIDPNDKTPPDTVTGLTATALGAFQVALSWTEPKDDRGVNGYRLMRDGKLLTETEGSGTEYTDAGLTPLTTYAYQIIALDGGAHESAPSDTVTVKTTEITGGDLYALNCSGCHGDLGVSAKRDRSVAEIKGAMAAVGAMAFLAEKLNDEQIAAIAAALSSLALDKTPPPALSAPTGTAVGPTAVSLSWKTGQDNPGGSGVAGYRLFRDGQNVVEIGTEELNYTDTELKPDTAYDYHIVVLDLAGNASAPSTVTVVKTAKPQIGKDETAPPVPAGLSAQVVSATRISLAWGAVRDEDNGSGLKGYRIHRNGQRVKDVGPAAAAFTDINLTAGQTYQYAVSAIDNSGNVSALSPLASAATPAADGLAIYHETCELCHNPIASTTKTDKTAAQIKQAILDIAPMNQFDVLGDDEIAAVAAALASVADVTAPSVPAGLTATAASAVAVNLSWNASNDAGSGVKGYRLFRGDVFVKEVPSPVLTAADTGLTPSTLYSYKIAAVDLAGNVSGETAVVTVTTQAPPTTADTTPPSVPGGVAGVALSHRQIRLTWLAATDNAGGSGVKSYRVIRDGMALPDVDAPALTLTDSGLAPQTAYHYRLIAIDTALNQSGLSTNVVVTTPAVDGAALYGETCATCHGPLATSTKLGKTLTDINNAIGSVPNMASLTMLTTAEKTAIATALVPPLDTTDPTVPGSVVRTVQSHTQIDLSWAASTDVGGSGISAYRIYRNDVLVRTVPEPDTSVSDTGLTASTTYSYRIAAVDVAGNESNKSPAVSGTTQATPAQPDVTPPAVPTGLTATAVAYNRINLSWNASADTGGSGMASYKLMIGTTVVATVSSAITSYAHLGRAPGTAYTYKVVAVDGAGNASAPSATSTATTLAIDGAAIYAATCANCHNDLATSLKKNRTLAQISAAIAAIPAMSNLSVLTVAERTAVAAALAPPPDVTDPSVPTNLAGAPQGTTSISLSWGASTDDVGVVSYKLYRADVHVRTVSAPGTAVTDTGLTAATTYAYKVSAIDAAGNESAKSTVRSVATPSTQTPADTVKPTVPGAVGVVVNSYKQITVTWSASSDTGGSGVKLYKVFRNGVYYKTVNAPSVNLIDASVAPDVTYTYKVAAVDIAGNQSSQSVAASGRTPVINGATLYNNKNCASCHGALTSSAKMGASEALITMALANIPAMSSINLSTHEIAALAKALRPVEPPVSEQTERFAYVPPVGTRHYMASQMRGSFLPAGATFDASDTAIDAKIKAVVENQVGALGGPCSRYDATCLSEVSMAVTLFAPMSPVTNAARRGFMTRACDEVLSSTKAVTNALTRAGLTAASPANATTIAKAYRLFYVETSPTTAVSNALLNLHQHAISDNYSTTEAWRFTLTAVCDSAGADAL